VQEGSRSQITRSITDGDLRGRPWLKSKTLPAGFSQSSDVRLSAPCLQFYGTGGLGLGSRIVPLLSHPQMTATPVPTRKAVGL